MREKKMKKANIRNADTGTSAPDAAQRSTAPRTSTPTTAADTGGISGASDASATGLSAAVFQDSGGDVTACLTAMGIITTLAGDDHGPSAHEYQANQTVDRFTTRSVAEIDPDLIPKTDIVATTACTRSGKPGKGLVVAVVTHLFDHIVTPIVLRNRVLEALRHEAAGQASGTLRRLSA